MSWRYIATQYTQVNAACPILYPLVYSVAPADIVDPLIYDGFVEELVEVLEIKDSNLMVKMFIYIYVIPKAGGGSPFLLW